MNLATQRSVVGVCASTWLLIACSQSPGPVATSTTSTSQAQQSTETAIREAAQSYGKAIVLRDTDAILAFYTNDTWLFPPDASVAKTPGERRTYWSAQNLQPGVSDTVGITSRVEIANSAELAVEYGHFFQVTTASNGASRSIPHQYITTWSRQSDGHWKVIADMWNTGG